MRTNDSQCEGGNKAVGEGAAPTGPVPTHLLPSILATVFCCLPLGIGAIVFAAQASGANSRGDYAAAAECARKSALWGWLSFFLGLIVNLGLLAIYTFSGEDPVPIP